MIRVFLIDYENVNSAGLQGIGQVEPEDRVILFYSHTANTLSFELMDEMLSANVVPERVLLSHTGKNALDFQLVTFLGYLIARGQADEYFIISKDEGYRSAIDFCTEYLHAAVAMCPTLKAAFEAEKAGRIKTPGKAAQEKQPAPVSLRKRKTVVQLQPKAASSKDEKPQAQKKEPAKKQPEKNEAQKKEPEKKEPEKKEPEKPKKEPAKPKAPKLTVETVSALLEPGTPKKAASEILRCLQTSHSKTEFHTALQHSFDAESVKRYYHSVKPLLSRYD